MTSYSIDDINFLKKDTDETPTSFTPLFEIPGEIYNQDFPKRLKHTFPKNGHWTEVIDFEGDKVERWKKRVLERYVRV
jgi:hypothetical protein